MNVRSLLGIGGTSVSAVTSTSTVLLTSVNSTILSDEKNIKKKEKPTVPEDANQLITKLTSSTQYQEIECLKTHYKGIEDWTKATQTNDNPQLNWTSNNANDIEGCLMVEYHEWTYSSEMRNGNFGLIWSLKSEEEGLVTVFKAKIDNGKISINYDAYILKKENTTRKWSISYKQEDLNKEITDQETLSQWFPEAGEAMGALSDTSYWGLDLRFGNICKKDDVNCTEEVTSILLPKSNQWKWISMSGGKRNKIYEWSKNFNSWFNNLSPKLLGIKTQLEAFEGIWQKIR